MGEKKKKTGHTILIECYEDGCAFLSTSERALDNVPVLLNAAAHEIVKSFKEEEVCNTQFILDEITRMFQEAVLKAMAEEVKS